MKRVISILRTIWTWLCSLSHIIEVFKWFVRDSKEVEHVDLELKSNQMNSPQRTACYLTRAVSSPTSDIGKEVLAAVVSRVTELSVLVQRI